MQIFKLQVHQENFWATYFKYKNGWKIGAMVFCPTDLLRNNKKFLWVLNSFAQLLNY